MCIMFYNYYMRILYLYKEEWEKDYMAKKLSEHEVSFYSSFGDVSSDVLNTAEVLSVFVCHLITKEDLEDGLHPNAGGHEKIFQKVKDFLIENKII